MLRGKTFYLDKRNGKVMGVCAGIASHFGWDPTIVRIGVVLLTLFGCFPWTLIAYGAVAWIAKPQPSGLYASGELPPARGSARQAREAMRDIDRRMAEVDSFVATPNNNLAREIESLR
jgi:phage shock protein C